MLSNISPGLLMLSLNNGKGQEEIEISNYLYLQFCCKMFLQKLFEPNKQKAFLRNAKSCKDPDLIVNFILPKYNYN